VSRRPTHLGPRHDNHYDEAYYHETHYDDVHYTDGEYDAVPADQGGAGARDWSDAELGWAQAPLPNTDDAASSGGAEAGGWLPAQVEVAPRAVCVDGRWAATLVVVGWPREVFPGWLEPLTAYPAPLELSLHIDSVTPEVAARQLRRQLARLESSRHGDATSGRLIDPQANAAAADAHELSERLARAETRLHRVGLALTVHAEAPDELAEHVRALRSLAASLLIDARPTTFRALAGWATTLPIGVDGLGQRRAMDTDAAAALFPFASPDLPAAHPLAAATPEGILYGHNIATHALVIHDRFAQPNYNAVVLASSGAGKSYLVKLETLRGLYRGIHVVIIDPEDEYAALAATVGGTHIRLGAPGVRVNPFDLPGYTGHGADDTTTDTADDTPADGDTDYPGPDHFGHRGDPGDPTGRVVGDEDDVLTRRALFVHSVLAVLLGELSPTEAALLDVGIHTAYARAGITGDPATWTRTPPLLADLAAALAELTDPLGPQLATRLAPYVTGSFSGLFAGPTTHQPSAHLSVYSLRALPEQLLGVGTLLALDATWRTVAHPTERRPRVVVVDEAWLLLAHPAGAAFLLRLAKAARKHWCGLTLVTQDAGDVLSTDLGRAVVSNAATTFLLRTAPAAAERIAAAYHLSDGERDFLTSADTGAGLLHAGSARVALKIHASDAENYAITTDPRELAARSEPDHHEQAYPADPPQAPAPLPPDHHDTRSAPMTAPLWEEGPDPL
jgi:hypothetical protein